MTRLPLAVAVAILVALALAACGSSSSSSSAASPSTTASSSTSASGGASAPSTAGLVATLQAPGHSPKVNANWPITVTLTKDGKPARGHISYAFLLGGQVVSTRSVGKESPNFVGTFHDTINWPADSVGQSLTFRVIVQTAYGTKNLDYAVKVTR